MLVHFALYPDVNNVALAFWQIITTIIELNEVPNSQNGSQIRYIYIN